MCFRRRLIPATQRKERASCARGKCPQAQLGCGPGHCMPRPTVGPLSCRRACLPAGKAGVPFRLSSLQTFMSCLTTDPRWPPWKLAPIMCGSFRTTCNELTNHATIVPPSECLTATTEAMAKQQCNSPRQRCTPQPTKDGKHSPGTFYLL